MREYQICTRCVMDTSDPAIQFDERGICTHCHTYAAEDARARASGAANRQPLSRLVATMQEEGRGKDYDCIIGVSGGVDSTYVAYQTKRLGLRPLAVHLDNGWNSELAVHNVARALESLGIDLYTHVIDWEEFRDLHLAFLRASVINSEIPTDHAILATLYRVAAQQGTRFILSGSNTATEGVLPAAWVYNNKDLHHIKAIHRRFGTRRLQTFPTLSLARYLYYVFARRIENIPLLNYLEYDKAAAKATIVHELGWRDYGGKHHESVYTAFYQAYILPRKFGVDKRRAHVSSLICAGQMQRDQGLAELATAAVPERKLEEYRTFVIKKLGLSDSEFEAIMALPPRRHDDFPTNAWLYSRLTALYRRLTQRGRPTVPLPVAASAGVPPSEEP